MRTYSLHLVWMKKKSYFLNTVFSLLFLSLITNFNIAQINIHHHSSASGILYKKLAGAEFNVSLILYPYTHWSKISGLSINEYYTFYDTSCPRPKSCIMVRSRLKGLFFPIILMLVTLLSKLNFSVRGIRVKLSSHLLIFFMRRKILF